MTPESTHFNRDGDYDIPVKKNVAVYMQFRLARTECNDRSVVLFLVWNAFAQIATWVARPIFRPQRPLPNSYTRGKGSSKGQYSLSLN